MRNNGHPSIRMPHLDVAPTLAYLHKTGLAQLLENFSAAHKTILRIMRKIVKLMSRPEPQTPDSSRLRLVHYVEVQKGRALPMESALL